MRLEYRRQILVGLLQHVAAVGLDQILKQLVGPVQKLPGLFHRGDRVIEGRLGRIIGDGVEVGRILNDPGLNSRFKVCVLDLIEAGRVISQAGWLCERAAGRQNGRGPGTGGGGDRTGLEQQSRHQQGGLQ